MRGYQEAEEGGNEQSLLNGYGTSVWGDLKKQFWRYPVVTVTTAL